VSTRIFFALVSAIASMLAVVPSIAHAHPHGQISCSAKLSFQQGRVHRIALALEVDADNSAKILHQQIIDAKTGEPQGPRGLMLKNLVGKAFREQDWLVALRPEDKEEGAPSTTPPAVPNAPSASIPLLEKSPVGLKKLASGALQVSLELEPDWSKAQTADAYVLACQDPSWFWVASFDSGKSVQTQGPLCQAQAIDDQLKLPNAPQALLTRFKLVCAMQ
jgi:hypothetical protein